MFTTYTVVNLVYSPRNCYVNYTYGFQKAIKMIKRAWGPTHGHVLCGIVVVREFARHRYRQSQLVGLTREQLTAIARDAQRQRAGATRGEELAALVVELAQQRVVPAAERHGG